MPAIRLTDLQRLSSRLRTASAAVGELSRPGQLVMKVGRIARPTWKIRNVALPAAEPLTYLTLDDVVFVERSMKARPQDKQDWLYVYARPGNGDKVGEGWVRSDGVLLDPPDPEATVEYIPSQTNLLDIAAKHYEAASGFRWGDDKRFYVAALAYVNRHYGGIIPKGLTDADFKERGRWADIGVVADHAIWIPRREYLLPLKGQFVSSGSISYELYQKLQSAAATVWEGVVGFTAFAAGLAHGALLAVYDALMELVELLQLVWRLLRSVLTGEVVHDAKKLWEAVKNLDLRQVMGDIAGDFLAKWEADSTWARSYFQGKVLGYVMATAALALLTAGATAAAGAAGKLGKLARAVRVIANNPVVRRVIGNPTVKKIIDKAQDALNRSPELKKLMADLAFKGLRLTRGYDPRMGIPDEHLRPMIEAAHELGVIAIFRANKKSAIPLIRKGAHGKPMWAKFKTDPDTGVLTAKAWPEYATAHQHGHYTVSDDGKSMFMMTNGTRKETPLPRDVFWTVKPGQVIHPDGKPIVGDYDLLGVAPVHSPGSNVSLVPEDVVTGDWNGPWAQKYAEAVNGRLDKPRVLHGAQDAYGGKPEYMGLTDDTAYAVFPDGRTYIMEGRQAQQEFYDALGRQAKSPGAPVGKPGWHLDGDRVVR